MKHIAIITSALILLASHATAEFSGRMDCKVKSNKIMEIEEGIPKEYTHFKDSFVVGDKLTLTYGFKGQVSDSVIFFHIEDNTRGTKNYLLYEQIKGDGVEVWRNDESKKAGFNATFNRLTVTPDKITSTSSFLSNINLERYYKNDWQGLISRTSSYPEIHIYTLDCRHKKDELDNMFQQLSIESIIQKLVADKSKKNEEKDDLARSAKIELYELRTEELTKQLDEAKKRIAELEVAQE